MLKSGVILPLESEGRVRSEGLESSSRENSERDTRMFAGHQQCSTKDRVRHTLPENGGGGRGKTVEVVVQAAKLGDTKLINTARKAQPRLFQEG